MRRCVYIKKFHKDKWLEWWQGRYDKTKDEDRDWIPDLYEDELGTNPFLRCSCDKGICDELERRGGRDYKNDNECLAWKEERKWKACSAIEEDYSDIRFYNEYTYCK